ncbi:B3 domain-containing transcription repressor VAL2-like isoform X2 [Argentina anserina]|uniref:B3 domain-containing transcription repressor VAL2-like isoform X2 n=1 Tax=Argentina anserina TaxID=57926 RepID=UPI0021764684|nr:B3 domain-containing transcription repressor VAL2-like isoform X2 [Potentilla anserina]
MATKICMNVSCGTSNTHEWKDGWPLRSGGFAHLCYKCGAAYEKSVFCDTFHLGETGWRDCSSCHKPLHCGCVASRSLYECLDYGGVGCIGCTNSSQPRVIQRNDVLNGFSGLTLSNAVDRNSSSAEYRAVGGTVDEGKFLQLCGTVDEGKLLQLCKIMEANESTLLPQSPTGEESVFLESTLLPRPLRDDKSESLGQTKGQEVIRQIEEVTPGIFNTTQSSIGSLTFPAELDNGRTMIEANHMSMPSSQPSLRMSLGTPSGTPNLVQPFSGGHVDIREQSKTSSAFQQVQKPRPILPRPLKPALPVSCEINNSARIARPPAEGRGKNQLLPRYWPRITDQELQKLSGALNSTIVPLFEKVLSASDAGRIGRLVLPKACAEAYFPPISHSEGLPLRIQDVKGNEWTFQFRFWPNNNSRMYVLEGVTPCIQSMQLQAGDTVTFSRIDPGNKLVIGFRKASQSVNMQGPPMSILPNGTPGETSYSSENLATGSGDSSLFHLNKGSEDPHLNSPLDHHLAEWDTYMHKNESNGHRNEDLLQPVPNSEKKRTRNIGPKSKRLLMHSEDVMELRLTWEEAQDLLRPPPSIKPNIVTIEDFEFEEYDEPPVFGKRSIFTAGPSKRQEQWAQCDDCSKWRKLPVDVLLPPKWTCSENSWDSSRSSCTAPEEMSSKQLDSLLSSSVSLKGLRKRRKILEKKEAEEHEPSGLDALASAAILGDNVRDSGEQLVGATTKHPRHRPGCTCIVCIQPPSGKGKHKPSCKCNVCLTVKRRFTTMMQRKNEKRQLEREAENSLRNNNNHKDESEVNGTTSADTALHMNHLVENSQRNNNNHKDESGMNGTTSGDTALHRKHSSENGASSSHSRTQADAAESSSARQIDLNCEPSGLFRNPTLQDLLKLAKAASAARPLEKYTNETSIGTMMGEEQAGLASCSLTQANGDNDIERRTPNEVHLSAVAWDCPRIGDKVYRETDLE